jgi:gliding motility-associated-like protein
MKTVIKWLFFFIVVPVESYSQVQPSLSIFPDDTVCIGEQVSVSLLNFSGNVLWSTGSTVPTISVVVLSDTGFTVINNYGSQAADTLQIFIHITPPVNTFIDIHSSPACAGQAVNINVINPVRNVLWSTGSTGHSLIVTPDTTTSYFVINNAGTVCADTLNFDIYIYPPAVPQIAIIPNDTVCPGEQISVELLNPVNAYTWSTGETTAAISLMINEGSMFTVINDYNGTCPDSLVFSITVIPVSTLGEDVIVRCAPLYTLKLIPPITGGSFLWSTGDTTQWLTVANSGLYTVTASNGFCTFSDSVNVKLNDAAAGSPWIPNVFTPNGDGRNDKFYSYGMEEEKYSMAVYDRWGRKIFYSENTSKGWDGKDYLTGTYVYMVKYKNPCNNHREIKYGTVTLIR